MGNYKTKLREGTREFRETGKEAIDDGSEMKEEADQINALIDSIHLVDSEDIQGVSEIKPGMESSFENAFSERVESTGTEVAEQSEQISDEAGDELGNVRSGISKLEMAAHTSEIGREAADSGAARLEDSGEEYENISFEAEGASDAIQQEIQHLKNNLGRIFR